MCMRRPTERLPTTSARPTATRPRSCPRMTAQWRASGLLRCPEKPGGGLVTICWRVALHAPASGSTRTRRSHLP